MNVATKLWQTTLQLLLMRELNAAEAALGDLYDHLTNSGECPEGFQSNELARVVTGFMIGGILKFREETGV